MRRNHSIQATKTIVEEERIWAPWRMAYVSQQTAPQSPGEHAAWMDSADKQCFLCQAAARYDDQPGADRANLLVQRTDQMSVVLNRYPYTNGHLLVSPLQHIGQLDDLSDQQQLESVQLLNQYTQRLSKLIRAEGFNIGLNLGAVAGAGVPGHLHWHLVPRWSGDGNFMPTVAGVRVISQSLEALWEALTEQVS